jgi:hypothetical protein
MRKFLAFLIVLVAGCSSHPAALLKGGELLPSIQWRLEVRDPHGLNPVYVTAADPVVALVEFGVAGDGNCLEGQFIALGRDLPIGAHSIVTLQKSTDGTIWPNLHAGEVLRDAAPRSNNRGLYKTVGLKERLKTVEVPGTGYASGDAGAIARQAVQDVIASGGLGSVLVYDAALIPDTGTTVGAVTNTQYHSLYALLDALAASHDVDGDGNPVSWGVNADRKLFFGVAVGSVSLTEGIHFHKVDWKDRVAEDTVTAVRFWLSPFLSYLTQDDDLVALYGLRVKQVPVENPLDVLDPMTNTLDWQTTVLPLPSGPSGTSFDSSYGTDGVQDAGLAYRSRVADEDDVSFVRISRTVTYASGVNIYTGPGLYVDITGADAVGIKAVGTVTSTRAKTIARFDSPAQGVTDLVSGIFPASSSFSYRPMLTSFVIWGEGVTDGDTATVSLDVRQLLGFKIDRAALDLEAKAHFRAPANDPAVITTVDGTLTPPAPVVTVNLLSGESLELPAASFGYKFETKSYATTVIRLGQVDEPNELARAQIIANRDDATLANGLQYVNAVQGVK